MNAFMYTDEWTASEVNKLLSNEGLYSELHEILKNVISEDKMYEMIMSICIAYTHNLAPDHFDDIDDYDDDDDECYYFYAH